MQCAVSAPRSGAELAKKNRHVTLALVVCCCRRAMHAREAAGVARRWRERGAGVAKRARDRGPGRIPPRLVAAYSFIRHCNCRLCVGRNAAAL